MKKEVKEFIKKLESRGWFIKRTSGSHIILNYRCGGSTSISRTPSDFRSLLNAESDARKIEAKYGPWIPEKKEGRSFGLDYQRPLLPEEAVTNMIPVPVFEDTHPENFEQIEKNTISSKELKEKTMPIENRQLIVSILEEKMKSISEQIAPYKKLFEEYCAIEKVLKDFQVDQKPDKEKIQEYIKEKGVTKVKRRLENALIYSKVFTIVQQNSGKLGIEEIVEWLRDIEKIELGTEYFSSGSHLVHIIRRYNEANPDCQKLIPTPHRPSKRGWWKYEYVEIITESENNDTLHA